MAIMRLGPHPARWAHTLFAMRHVRLLASRGLATRPPLEENAYAVLGVTRGVSQAELKSAYRKMARAWHPDVSTRKDARAVFPHITRSYEILSDKQQRHAYDYVLDNRIPLESPEAFQAFYERAVQSRPCTFRVCAPQ